MQDSSENHNPKVDGRADTVDGHAVPDAERPSQGANCGKNPAAVALGRLGGLKGGKARAHKLTAQERQEIARKAAQARWKSNGDEDTVHTGSDG